MDRDLSKDIFSSQKLGNYKTFSASRKMPVTVIIGVGGEPCNPELLYVIPLERIDDIVSNNNSIVGFLCQSRSLDASLFLRKESPKEKAYTLDDKRKEYANAYKPWRREDDEQLLALCSEGKNVKELSQFFIRNEGAIRSRIKKLSENGLPLFYQ